MLFIYVILYVIILLYHSIISCGCHAILEHNYLITESVPKQYLPISLTLQCLEATILFCFQRL